MPAPFSAIVGRAGAIATVRELLERRDVRLVTLTGPGGIGKSRLAIEVAGGIAAEGRDVVFVSLEAVRSAEFVLPAIAHELGVRDSGDGPLQEKILTALAQRRLLLVLDNMEHVLDAASVVIKLISTLPELTVLVTSRSPLRVRAGAHVRGAAARSAGGGCRADAAGGGGRAVGGALRRAGAGRAPRLRADARRTSPR